MAVYGTLPALPRHPLARRISRPCAQRERRELDIRSRFLTKGLGNGIFFAQYTRIGGAVVVGSKGDGPIHIYIYRLFVHVM